MAMPTTVPITIRPEAAARVAELGMQAEFERMVEHTVQTVPGLRSIDVRLALPYDTGDEVRVLLEAMLEKPFPGSHRVSLDWIAWKHETFSREVCECFGIMTVYGDGHGR